MKSPLQDLRSRLAGDGFGDALILHGGAAIEEAAGGEEFGVKQGGASSAANQIVREQRELYIEQGAFADAADDGGHAVARVRVATRLGATLVVEDNDGIAQGGRQRSELGVDFKIAQGLADFFERGDFFQADGDAFEVAVDDRNAIAMGAKADASINEPRAIPFAEQLLWLKLHFFFFTADEGNDVALNIHRGDAGIACAGDGLQSHDENLFESKSIGERL